MESNDERGIHLGCQNSKNKNFVPKKKIGNTFEGLGRGNVGIFSGRSEYFTAFLYILWPLGNLVSNLLYFPPFWYIELS
jgi:hypothetical protein